MGGPRVPADAAAPGGAGRDGAVHRRRCPAGRRRHGVACRRRRPMRRGRRRSHTWTSPGCAVRRVAGVAELGGRCPIGLGASCRKIRSRPARRCPSIAHRARSGRAHRARCHHRRRQPRWRLRLRTGRPIARCWWQCCGRWCGHWRERRRPTRGPEAERKPAEPEARVEAAADGGSCSLRRVPRRNSEAAVLGVRLEGQRAGPAAHGGSRTPRWVPRWSSEPAVVGVRVGQRGAERELADSAVAGARLG